jgi:hypothetical protein
MRQERGQITGAVRVIEPYTLWGAIAGQVTVARGGKMYIRGSIYGNLILEDGGRVHIYGNVQGDVTVQEGAKVIVTGAVGGDVINNGGRVYVELPAKIGGKVKTKSGKTVFEKDHTDEDHKTKRSKHD